MTFLDTNVLIYSIDGKDPAKQAVARDIVVSAVRQRKGSQPVQELLEVFNLLQILKPSGDHKTSTQP